MVSLLSYQRKSSMRLSRRNGVGFSFFLPWLKPHKKQIIFAFLSVMLVVMALLSLGRGIALLVDGGLNGDTPETLDRAVLVCLAIALVLAIGSYLRSVLVNKTAERIVTDIRKAVFRHVVGLPSAWFETQRRGDIISMIGADTVLIQSVMASGVSMATRNVIVVIGGLVMLVLASAKLTLVVIGVVIVVVIPVVLLGRLLRRQSRLASDKIADISVEIEETLAAISTIHAFRREDTVAERFNGVAEDSYQASLKRLVLQGMMSGMVIMITFSAISFILWLGGKDMLAGRLSAGELSAFVFYAALVAASIAALSDIGGEIQRALGAAERISDVMAEKAVIRDPEHPVSYPVDDNGTARSDIAFNAVSFTYPARPDRPALHEVSFSIAHGERVAIVGESGAGKTTIFKMLLRFYDPTSGQVRIGGIDTTSFSLDDLRRHIAIVPQDIALFSASIIDNIRFGRPDATLDEVVEAARQAHADDFISRFAGGYDTHVGEKGVRLSGGQQQRLAIARAMLRNAPILLLDEATSSLDAASEQTVQLALDSLMRDRTTLVIAHRLATVISADRIIVIDQGRVVSIGTHEELLTTSSVYHRLASLQFMIS